MHQMHEPPTDVSKTDEEQGYSHECIKESMTLSRTSAAACAVCLLAIVARPSMTRAETQATAQNFTSPVVVTTGESTIKTAPDQAWVTVSVDTRDTRGPEARRLGAVAMTSVLAALAGAGLPADAIQTVGFSLRPEYDYANGRQRMKGFVVSNQIQARVDDIGRVADVLDAVGGLSLPTSSMSSIGSVRFDLKDRVGVERRALRQAVEDATARATVMALGAGREVGMVLRIEEAGADAGVMKFEQPMMMSRAGDAQVSTPIAPSDIEIRATVRVTMAIK